MKKFISIITAVMLFCTVAANAATSIVESDYSFVPNGGYIDVPDVNASGLAVDIAFLGHDSATNQPLILVKDATTDSFIRYISIFDSTWTIDTNLKKTDDANANGYPELAVKATNSATGQIAVQFVDSFTGLDINRIVLNATPPALPEIPPNSIVMYNMSGSVGSVSKKHDSVGNIDNDLIEVGVFSSAHGFDGEIDGAYAFNGSQYLKVGNGVAYMPGTNAFTVSFLVNTMSTTTGGIVAANQQGSRKFLNILLSQGRVSVELGWIQGVHVGLGCGSNTAINDGGWHEVDVVFFNEAVARCEVWIDGMLDVQNSHSSYTYNIDSLSSGWFIGSVKNWASGVMQQYIVGSIDRVSIKDGIRRP